MVIHFINTAISMSSSYDSVFVVGEDIDLLVPLTVLARHYQNVHFQKPGEGNIVEKIYSSRSLQYGDIVADNTLFLHAFSGCNNTSSIYTPGKIKFLNVMKKYELFNEIIQIFKDENVNREVIISTG